MAYSQHNITAITEIPALVRTFASANGFTVAGTTSLPVISVSGGIAFQLAATISGNDHDLTWTADSSPVPTSSARIRSPKLSGTAAAPNVAVPSKLHIFGGQSPRPYIALVIQYSPNLFRHLYYGYLETLGGFTGGEVIAGTSFYNSAVPTAYPISYRDPQCQYLFGASQTGLQLADCGGARVVHTDNATPWRRFRAPTSTPQNSWTGGEIVGGFKDDVNDGYLARGLSSYAGVNLLTPINLYATQGSGAAATFVPLGNPAGVRMVNMTGLEPGTSMTIASRTWRVFPAFTKSNAETVNIVSGGWGAGETSGMVGYAYPES